MDWQDIRQKCVEFIKNFDIKPTPPSAPSLWEKAKNFYHGGLFNESVEYLLQILTINAKNYHALDYLTHSYMMLGKNNESYRALKRAIGYYPKDYKFWGRLAYLYATVGNVKRSIKCYKQALKINDNLESTQYLLDAVQKNNIPNRPPLSYVKDLFDGSASYFEEQLVNQLYYRGHKDLARMLEKELAVLYQSHYEFPCENPTPIISPAKAGASLQEAKNAAAQQQNNFPGGKSPLHSKGIKGSYDTSLQVLDLGCGTGLCAEEILKRFPNHTFTGVDISTKMLEYAREKGIYQDLHNEDILEFLRRTKPAQYDIIIASDVFVYLGDLSIIYEMSYKCLKPGGWLCFSVENLESDACDFEIVFCGRYKHSLRYIKKLQQKFCFNMIKTRAIALRMEYSEPVIANLVLLQK